MAATIAFRRCMTLSSRGCQLLGRDDMVIATMSTSSIRHQGGDRNMLPRRPPRNFDNRTRGMSPRRPRTTHNSEDEDGMTFREATNTMRMHHTTGRRKIKDWTRHGKLDKVEAFVEHMGREFYTPNTNTYNHVIMAYGTRSEYVPKAFKLLHEKMFTTGGLPNDRTYLFLFDMCAVHYPNHYFNAASLYRLLFRRKVKVDQIVANAAIKCFAKYGDSSTALKIYADMKKKDMTVAPPKPMSYAKELEEKAKKKRRMMRGENVEEAEESTLEIGTVIRELSDEEKQSETQFIEKHFSPFSELKPCVITYTSLLHAAARDLRHRLFRPTHYLAINLRGLEEIWTPDLRRRYALDMADALWENILKFRVQVDSTLFCALLTAYRDGGRVEHMRLPKDFLEERGKQLSKEKATLSRYDASKELRQLTGETMVSEIKAEQVEKVSEHFDMQYDDDADDAVAAFWVDDVESLKIPLSAEETKALDDRRIPFGSISGFLKMMAAHQVAPTEDIFSLLMQCQLCGITQGPLQAHAGQTQRILKELKRVDCLELMKHMKAHDCSMNDQFFYSLLKQYTMLRDYEAALKLIHSCSKFGLPPLLKYYNDLASCCKTPEQAFDLLMDVRESGLKPDARLYECLVSAAFLSRRPMWAFHMITQLVETGLIPTANTASLVHKFLLSEHAHANKGHVVACQHLRKYCKEVVVPLVRETPRQHTPDESARNFLGLGPKQTADRDSDAVRTDAES